MRIGDFGVRISQGNETKEAYVQLKHNTEYAIDLWNGGDTDCDAILTIDGNRVGNYRIEAHDTISIQRPSNVERNFIFLKIDTAEAQAADLQRNDSLGLVTVEFTPARYLPVDNLPPLELYGATKSLGGGMKRTTRSSDTGYRAMYGGAGGQGIVCNSSDTGSTRSGSKGMVAGGTGLGSQSSQKFVPAKPIDHDLTKRVTINLRLVAIEDRPAIIPLRSNNVPPSLL